MKQVWKTNDGAVFDDKEQAEAWESSKLTAANYLGTFIYNNTMLNSDDSMRLAKLLMAVYKIEPQT